MRLTSSAVAQTADRLGIPALKPQSLRDPTALDRLREAAPDVMVVAAYGLILPQSALDLPRWGCLNIHASLLPRWRGAAPIQRALLAGDAVTGITLMKMDAGLDTGPMISLHEMPISVRDTAGSLTESLSALGAHAVIDALARLDDLRSLPQDDALATYAAKIAKSEARIEWSRPAEELDRQVRAFNPSPGAESRLAGEALKIGQAAPMQGAGAPGEVLEAEGGRFLVACGRGALLLETVQRPGGRRLSAADFLRGAPVKRGDLLETAAPDGG
jgi:methionyl-tRNA formyltransferase